MKPETSSCLRRAGWRRLAAAVALAAVPVLSVASLQARQGPPPPPATCPDTVVNEPLPWDLDFVPDPGVRLRNASLPKPFVDEAGRVHLFYQEHTGQGGRNMYTVSDDGLSFPPGRPEQPRDYAFFPYRVRMPNGVWRLYQFDQAAGELRSRSSGDGVVFTGDAGARYRLRPEDQGWMGIHDEYVDPQGRLVLLYLGDMRGLNNIRRAVSTDNGWTFVFDRGDVLGDAEDARTRGPQWAFVDQKSTPLTDGRRRLFAMRAGCAIYSFITRDGDRYAREPGARVTTTSFPGLRIRSLHDPLVVRLADGRYRMYVHAALEGETGGNGLVIVSATTRPPDRDPPQTPGPPVGPPPPPDHPPLDPPATPGPPPRPIAPKASAVSP